MTWPSTLAWCAASSAIVAVPLLLRLSAVKRDLATARQSANLFAAWWERDSGKMLIAQAQLDLIREQRRMAGRQSHKAERALIAARTEELRRCVAARSIQPVVANPAPGFPAAHSAAPIEGGRGRETPQHDGQDTGAGQFPDVTQRARVGNAPGQSCRRNRAGDFAPADFTMKGASHG